MTDTLLGTGWKVEFGVICAVILTTCTTSSVLKVISVGAVDTLSLVAGVTSFGEASLLLTFVSRVCESGLAVTVTTSVGGTFGSTPAVYTFMDFMSGTGATACVTFVADITAGASACACCVTFFTFAFEVKVLVPVTVDEHWFLDSE